MENLLSENMQVEKGEIVVYQPDEITKLEVRVRDETVWLTQEQIAQLFGVKRPAITKHIRNIFQTQELEEISVCSILELTAADGKKYTQRRIVLIDNYIDETVLTMLDKRNIRSGLDSPLWNTLVLNFC